MKTNRVSHLFNQGGIDRVNLNAEIKWLEVLDWNGISALSSPLPSVHIHNDVFSCSWLLNYVTD